MRAGDINDNDRRKIAEAVREAESRTGAEIVPAVASDSGRYDRAEDIVGLIAGVGAMVVAWLLFQREDPAAGGWDGLGLRLQLWALVAIVIGGFVVGSALAAAVPRLRRLFVPRGMMIEEVLARAAQLFHDQRIHHTQGEGGVLVYVSLFERQAVILADARAFEALGQAAIDEACRLLSADLKRGDVAAALCGAIGRLGGLLAAKMPRSGADRNEIADALITIG